MDAVIKAIVADSSTDDQHLKYYDALERSKNELEQDKDLVTFTIDELEAYSNSKSAEEK